MTRVHSEGDRWRGWLARIVSVVLALFLAACAPVSAQPAPIPTLPSAGSQRELPPILTENPATPTILPYPQPPPTPTARPERHESATVTKNSSPETPPSFQSAFSGALRLGQHEYQYLPEQKTGIRFLMYLPNSYDPQKKWPLILFLHSSLEKGSDLNKLKERALPKKLDGEGDFPFIVVSPQIVEGYWFQNINTLESLLDQLEAALPVDSRRVYLTGFSLGGYGTWAYVRRHPERFAAIAPVAGSLDEGTDFVIPANFCNIQSVPVWAFHAANDTTVPPEEAARLVKAMNNCGGEARITIYPDAGHMNTGELAYADPALYDWFLSHIK